MTLVRSGQYSIVCTSVRRTLLLLLTVRSVRWFCQRIRCGSRVVRACGPRTAPFSALVAILPPSETHVNEVAMAAASEQEAVNITEKQLILEIIQIYKDFPCLWDSSHELYCNKDARNQALEIILEKWKTGYPHATIEDVKKKIEHLRAAYRRERKKVGILQINNTLCKINILIIFSKYIFRYRVKCRSSFTVVHLFLYRLICTRLYVKLYKMNLFTSNIIVSYSGTYSY